MMFSGKSPLADDLMRTLNVKPSILQRRKKVDTIITGINELVEVFDEGLGNLYVD